MTMTSAPLLHSLIKSSGPLGRAHYHGKQPSFVRARRGHDLKTAPSAKTVVDYDWAVVSMTICINSRSSGVSPVRWGGHGPRCLVSLRPENLPGFLLQGGYGWRRLHPRREPGQRKAVDDVREIIFE
jgi:hypothetical protein